MCLDYVNVKKKEEGETVAFRKQNSIITSRRMTSLLLILLASVSQALSVNAIRDIQANSMNIYRAVVWNYVACVFPGIIYIVENG